MLYLNCRQHRSLGPKNLLKLLAEPAMATHDAPQPPNCLGKTPLQTPLPGTQNACIKNVWNYLKCMRCNNSVAILNTRLGDLYRTAACINAEMSLNAEQCSAAKTLTASYTGPYSWIINHSTACRIRVTAATGLARGSRHFRKLYSLVA